MKEEKEMYVYKNKKKHHLIIIGLVVFNLIVYNVFVKNGGYDMRGNYIPYDTTLVLKSSLISFLVAFPILSLLLGVIVAFIPYKKLPYAKKYMRSVNITLLAINSLFFVGLLSIMMMTFIGWYPVSEDVQVTKNKRIEGIQKFEREVTVLVDSSNYYFDLGVEALDAGEDPIEISKKINEPLKKLQTQINVKSRSFSETASQLQLTQKEYDSVFGNLGMYAKSMKEKYNLLVAKGVKID